MRVLSLIFFCIVLFLNHSYGQTCTINTTQTNVPCNGASTGSASVSVTGGSGGGSNNCVSPQSPGSSDNCTTGCTSTITTNANVTVSSGQKVCITAGSYSGQIQLDGGTAVICGSGTTPSIIFNGGALVITGSATISSINNWSSAASSITNYGTLTFSSATSLEVGFNNHGTTNIAGGLTMGFGSSGFTNTGTLNISSGNLVFDNNGTAVNSNTISITSGTLLVDYSKAFTNNCTLTVGSTLTNHGTFINSGPVTAGGFISDGGSFTNNSTMAISGSTNFSGGTISIAAGSEITTTNFESSIAVNGTGATCASIKTSGNTTFNWGAAFTGQARYCDLNGTIESNTPNVTTNVSLTTCSCNVSAPICTYSWKNSSNTEISTSSSVSSLTAGTYTITATCSGCSNSPLSSSVTITEPSAFTANASATGSCTGGNNGSVTVTASGGVTPYTYSWTNASSTVVGTTQTVSNLPGGVYTVVITDAGNCSLTRTVTLNQSSVTLSASATHTDASCNGGANGSIDLSVAGGVAPYTYLWSPGGQTTQDLSGLASGTYTVTVTDAAACSTSISVTVAEPGATQVTTTKTDVTCQGLNNGTATVNATPPSGSTSAANNCTTAAPMDCNSGCTNTINTNQGNINISNATDKICLTGTITTGELNVGAGTLVICGNVTSGNVNVTNGGTVIITGSGALTLTSGSNFNNSSGCVSASYGTLNIAGDLNNSGSFTNGNTISIGGSLHNNNGASLTNYCTITVTGDITNDATINNNGRITSSSITFVNGGSVINMSQGSELITNSLYLNGTINGPSSGTCASIKIGAIFSANTGSSLTGSLSACDATPAGSGDTAPAYLSSFQNCSCNLSAPSCTYSWKNISNTEIGTSQTMTGLLAGTYTVTASCGACASAPATVIITEPAAIVVTGQVNQVTCTGNNGSISTSVSGGVSPYTYLWNTSATTSGLTGLAAGTYSVTVKDANNCSQDESFIISQFNGTITLHTKNVNTSTFNVSGPGLPANTHQSGPSALPVTICPSLPSSGQDRFQINIQAEDGVNPLAISVQYNSNYDLLSVDIVKPGNVYAPLSTDYYTISNSEIIFYSRKDCQASTLSELNLNLDLKEGLFVTPNAVLNQKFLINGLSQVQADGHAISLSIYDKNNTPVSNINTSDYSWCGCNGSSQVMPGSYKFVLNIDGKNYQGQFIVVE